MMDVAIISSKISFKSPELGMPTYANEQCYNGRRVIAEINGEEKSFRFRKEDIPFRASEEDLEQAVKDKIEEENNSEGD